MRAHSLLVAGLLVCVAALTACGGGSKRAPFSAQTPASTPTMVSLQISPASPTMAVGGKQQLTATGAYSDGSTKDMTASASWASSNTGVVSVTSAGMATAAGPGQATLSATVGALQASTNVTVSPPPVVSLVSLQISPASPTMAVHGTQQFTATGAYSDGTTADITTSATWASSNAGVVSVTSAGMATAAGPGQATLSATVGALQASTNVTVSPPVVASIFVVPAAASIPIGATQQFSANGVYTDGSVRDVTSLVTWSSSSGASVNNSGLATGVSSGAAQITATISQVSGSATLTVTSATLQSITINPDMPSIPIGGNVQFTVTGIWSDGFTQDLQPGVASWSSSLPGVATIDAVSGLAIGAGAGVSTITASVGGLSDTTTILVSSATLASIGVTPNNPTISTLTRQQFSAMGTFTDGSTMDITASVNWNSSSTGVATIDQAGLAIPVAAGTTTISASFGAISGSTTLTVTGAKLLSIIVTPAMPTVPIGATEQFTATGAFDDGSNQDISTAVIWTSSSASVATISAAGMATTTGMGSATITASFGTVSGSTTLTVTAVELQYISVLPNNPALGFRMKMQFTAYANYNDGSSRVLAGVVWSSSKPQIASINGSGLTRSKHKSGPATITAHWNGLSGSTILTVSNATVVSITIAPSTAQIPTHTSQQYTATAQMSDGSSLDVTRSVHWGTSNYLVATINVGGLASGLAPGTVTINCTANNSSVSGSATLTVTNATISSLVLSPQGASLPLGAFEQFTATGNFSDGSSMDISSLVLWTSSNIAVADFSGTTAGLALSSGKGTTTIGASFQGATTSTSLTVF
jgi:hypothetical protein